MASVVAVMLGAIAAGAIVGAAAARWLHRRTRLSPLNVYLFAPVGAAAFVGSLATVQGALVVATGPIAAAGVVGAAVTAGGVGCRR